MDPGKRQKPVQLKKLQGTVRKDRDSGKEEIVKAQGSLSKLPPAPKSLKGEGLVYYQEQGGKYLEFGILTDYNLPLFLAICLNMSRLFGYYRKIDKLPDYDIDNTLKYQRVINEVEKNLRINMCEFGLTPASIGKITLPKKDGKTQLQKFMSGE
jgi:hypothetical protein